MDLHGWIAQQHYIAHFIIDDQVLKEIPRERWTERPAASGNSIAWLLWHTARCEDVATNVIVRGSEQVLTRDGWASHAGLGDDRIGAGFGDDEVAAFCEKVDLDALLAYRKAVRRETASWLSDVDPAMLDERPDLQAALDKLDLFPAAGQWVRDLWEPWPRSLFLNWVGIGHTYMHLGEMTAVRTALGVPGR